MSWHDTLIVKDTLIIKETHRGLLYEDGILREVLPAGRYRIPRPPSPVAAFLGLARPRAEVVLVDVRGRDRTVVVQDLLTAEGVTISASFVVLYRVTDPRAAIHRVSSFEDRLYAEVQAAARQALRGMTLDEVMGSRDETGEELLRQVGESAAAYGLEVSSVDFKDLVLPPELREALNRAAFARRLRRAGHAEDSTGDEPDESEVETRLGLCGERGDGRQGAGVVLARVSLDRDPALRDDSTPFRPHGTDPRGGQNPGGFDGLRRFRP